MHQELKDQLRAAIQGECAFDDLTRHIYSVDSSIFEVLPLGVITPQSIEDLQKVLKITHDFNIPVTIRGAATGITGGCLGRGIILDHSKYLTRILETDLTNHFVICEPGVIQDDLNRHLNVFHFRLGPDTSTGNRATLGGMLANNAAGARSLRFGCMIDHIEEVEVLLSNGLKLNLKNLSLEAWKQKLLLNDQEGEIYRTIEWIYQTQKEEILKQFPNIPRHVSGYPLDRLISSYPPNLAQLMAGSEGTLAIVTKMKLKIVPVLKRTTLFLIFFNQLLDAFQPIPTLLKHNPLSLELIDEQVIENGKRSPALKNRLHFLKESIKGLLIIELEGATDEELNNKINQLEKDIQQQKIGHSYEMIKDPQQIADVWALRKAGLGVLMSRRTYSRAIAFLEDLSIPPAHLKNFMEEFCTYLNQNNKQAGIYGHAGSGCLHIRPYIDLRNEQELFFMRQMMLDISSMVLKYGGAISGEHGDGLIRSWLNPKIFGSQIMHVFKKLKDAFDPKGLMNPDKIIPLTDDFETMRLSPSTIIKEIPTFLDFSSEGGLALAADLCNGNGQCRKKEGVMCPSYQVTLDEFHSTRARAQSLRSIIHGKLPLEIFTSTNMHAVMDLCISCKGCKTECPSQVDMAKMKSEFLYHYQKKNGMSLRSYLFSSIGRLNWWMSYFPRFFNWVNQTSFVKNRLEKIGISKKRQLPPITNQRFSHWFKNYQQKKQLKKIILFLDTFTEFNHPEIGKAAVHLLNALEYEVILSSWHCCGRPALSKGHLEMAKKQATNLVNELKFYVQKGFQIVGIEPSCLLTIRDDYKGLFGLHSTLLESLEKLQKQCLTFDEFLLPFTHTKKWQTLFKSDEKFIQLHGHCYQKALVGMKPTVQVLNAIPGFKVKEIASGCCGMAGSFGFESEHIEISYKIGDLKLFPALRHLPRKTWIVASGLSCRQQIQEGVNQKAYHLVELLAMQLQEIDSFLSQEGT